MGKIRVLATKKFFGKDLEYILGKIDQNVELILPDEYSERGIVDVVDGKTDVLLGEFISKKILDKAVGLRLIQIPWTGVDRLDFTLLQQYQIPVCNSHSNSLVVAEYAVGLLLSIMKHIPLHDRRLRDGEWMRPQEGIPFSFVPSSSLSGKTVCLVGYGAIGRHIARILSGFSMTVNAVVRRSEQKREPPVAEVFHFSSLPEALKSADAVVVAVPLTQYTEKMFNEDMLKNMKSEAYFVNISRGKIVDQDALYTALVNRSINGAAIDTWYNYPTVENKKVFPSDANPFHELDNVVMSPHRAGIVEGLLPHLDDSIENCNRLAHGKDLLNRIDFSEKY